jgi:hypothetical protein
LNQVIAVGRATAELAKAAQQKSPAPAEELFRRGLVLTLSPKVFIRHRRRVHRLALRQEGLDRKGSNGKPGSVVVLLMALE